MLSLWVSEDTSKFESIIGFSSASSSSIETPLLLNDIIMYSLVLATRLFATMSLITSFYVANLDTITKRANTIFAIAISIAWATAYCAISLRRSGKSSAMIEISVFSLATLFTV